MKLNELSKKSVLRKNPVFQMERKLNLIPLLVFVLVTAVLAISTIVVFPYIENMIQSMIDRLPEEIQQMILETSGGRDFADYFAKQMGQVWGLVGVIYAAYMGYNVICSNFKGSSSTLLYTLNLSRKQIVLNKLARLVLNLFWFNLAMGVLSVATVAMMGYTDVTFLLNIAIFTLIMFAASLLIGVTTFGAALLNPKKMSGFLSIFISVVSFFFSTIGYLGENLRLFAYLNPMGVFVADSDATILVTGFADVNYILLAVWALVAVVTVVVGYFNFRKKDLV